MDRQRATSVFFICGAEARSNRFPGPGWDIRTTPALWPPILCGAAYGLDFIWVASPISLTAESALRTQPPTGWARAVSTTCDSIQDGTLWAATEGGLSRLKNGRVATLTSKNGLPCDTVHWVMEDDAHSFWLHTACGLVRIARTELDAWAAAVEKDKDAKHAIQVTVFDSSDGVRSLSVRWPLQSAGRQVRGWKLWFLPQDGVNVVDPRHLPFNKLPPPVHIEQITADRKTYDDRGFNGVAPASADSAICRSTITALSLVAPEKIRFRYKLEGHDQRLAGRRQSPAGVL